MPHRSTGRRILNRLRQGEPLPDGSATDPTMREVDQEVDDYLKRIEPILERQQTQSADGLVGTLRNLTKICIETGQTKNAINAHGLLRQAVVQRRTLLESLGRSRGGGKESR